MSKNLEKIPDPVLHQRISFTKSVIRIAGYLFLLFSIPVGVCTLVASEILGLVEEMV